MWKQSSKKNFESAEQVYDYALNLLTIRDYGAVELRKKLAAKGADEEFINAVIVKLQHYGFLDERRYAFKVYESWKFKKYYGRMHLKMELGKKNVDSRYVNEVLDEFSEDEELSHAQAASKLFMQKYKKIIQQDDRKKIFAAAARFMAARGFSTRYVHVITDELHLENDM